MTASGDGYGCTSQPNRYPSWYGVTQNERWAGFQLIHNSSLGGVVGRIVNYSPWVYPGTATDSSSQVSAWVMLNTSGEHYAQVGWIEFAFGNRFTFTEQGYGYNPDGTISHATHTFYPGPTGENDQYEVLYVPSGSGGTFYYSREGTTWGWNDSASFVPNGASVASEVANTADQMPGGYNLREAFTGLDILAPATTPQSWYYFNDGSAQVMGVDEYPGWYGMNPDQSSGFLNTLYTWDQQCPY